MEIWLLTGYVRMMPSRWRLGKNLARMMGHKVIEESTQETSADEPRDIAEHSYIRVTIPKFGPEETDGKLNGRKYALSEWRYTEQAKKVAEEMGPLYIEKTYELPDGSVLEYEKRGYWSCLKCNNVDIVHRMSQPFIYHDKVMYMKQGWLYSVSFADLTKPDFSEDSIKKELQISEWDCIPGFPKIYMKYGGVWHTSSSNIMRNGKILLPYKDSSGKLKIITAFVQRKYYGGIFHEIKNPDKVRFLVCKHQSTKPIIDHEEVLENYQEFKYLGYKSLKARGDLVFCLNKQEVLVWLVRGRAASVVNKIEFPRDERVFHFSIIKASLVMFASKIELCLQTESRFIAGGYEEVDPEEEHEHNDDDGSHDH